MDTRPDNQEIVAAAQKSAALLWGEAAGAESFAGRLSRLFDAARGSDGEFILAADRFMVDFGDRTLDERLYSELFERFVSRRLDPAKLRDGRLSGDEKYFLARAAEVLDGVAAIGARIGMLDARSYFPAVPRFFAVPRRRGGLAAIAGRVSAADGFGASRSFRYVGGEFIPALFSSVKPITRFWGYPGVRIGFEEHFAAFAKGESNLPLLVNSLPGHGKTSMILSYAAARPELSLVLADSYALEEGWEKLIGALKRRPDRRFVLFFDDIDPRSVNWFNFRTHVGGAFSLPEHILVVLSANYEFPANILSRGRKISFPVFDEVRCMEMVEEFLTGFGLKQVNRNLVSQISADYTEEFGQKRFTELSPRSLTRYLKVYEHDFIKRKTMIGLAMGPMVTRPDAQLFYEFNIGLMRSLYGEEYIKNLLKQRLDDISKL